MRGAAQSTPAFQRLQSWFDLWKQTDSTQSKQQQAKLLQGSVFFSVLFVQTYSLPRAEGSSTVLLFEKAHASVLPCHSSKESTCRTFPAARGQHWQQQRCCRGSPQPHISHFHNRCHKETADKQLGHEKLLLLLLGALHRHWFLRGAQQCDSLHTTTIHTPCIPLLFSFCRERKKLQQGLKAVFKS